MVKGKVKFYNDMKGFGFISGEDGKEYFVHRSGLGEGVRLGENDAVTFEVTPGEGGKGPKATKVVKDTGSKDSVEKDTAPNDSVAKE